VFPSGDLGETTEKVLQYADAELDDFSFIFD
jgi:hypothetical protein